MNTLFTSYKYAPNDIISQCLWTNSQVKNKTFLCLNNEESSIMLAGTGLLFTLLAKAPQNSRGTFEVNLVLV